MENEIEEPPSKNIVDTGTANIPFDDIKGKQRMGIWHRLAQPILYPAGSSVCSRCFVILRHL